MNNKLMKKPTEVIVVFEGHVPSAVDFKKPYYEKADEIHLERTPELTEQRKRQLKTKTPKEIAKHTKRPEYNEKDLELLKEQLGKGKKVIGTDVRPEKSMEKLKEAETEYFKGNTRKSYEDLSESTRIRDEGRLKEELERLKESRGKTIIINAGSAHTPFYHALKKALKKEEEEGNITVRRVFASKGKVDADPRVLEKYSPHEQIERILTFKKGKLTKADEKRIQTLLRQDKRFEKEEVILREKYKKRITEEQALEKARFELLSRLTRRGLTNKTTSIRRRR